LFRLIQNWREAEVSTKLIWNQTRSLEFPGKQMFWLFTSIYIACNYKIILPLQADALIITPQGLLGKLNTTAMLFSIETYSTWNGQGCFYVSQQFSH